CAPVPRSARENAAPARDRRPHLLDYGRQQPTCRMGCRWRPRAGSRLDDHLQRTVDASVEGAKRLTEVPERKVMRDESLGGNVSAGQERYDPLQRFAVRAAAVG